MIPYGIRATDEAAADVRHGKRILPPHALPEGLREGKPVRLVDRTGSLVAVLTYRGPGEEMPIERGFS